MSIGDWRVALFSLLLVTVDMRNGMKARRDWPCRSLSTRPPIHSLLSWAWNWRKNTWAQIIKSEKWGLEERDYDTRLQATHHSTEAIPGRHHLFCHCHGCRPGSFCGMKTSRRQVGHTFPSQMSSWKERDTNTLICEGFCVTLLTCRPLPIPPLKQNINCR